MKRQRFLKWGLPAFAALMLVFSLLFVATRPKLAEKKPTLPPSVAPFENRVGGIGIVEPRSENIEIGTHIAGIVSKVHVKVGQQVQEGDPLFTIDDRDAKAQLALAEARFASSKVERDDARHQLSLFEKVSDRRAISVDEFDRRRYGSQLASAKVKEAEAQVNVYKTEIDRLTVKAPISGTVHRVDVRPGEYANGGNTQHPYVILGDTEIMHVRVEIDETDIPRVTEQAKVVASLRGYSSQKVDLSFVRKEPYILPKRSLTNDGNERVDTRVQ